MVDDRQTQLELEAEVLQTLLGHLRKRSDVQNIDLMNLAGFCRNCLSKWYEKAARDRGIELSRKEARKLIYGMEYDDWKKKYQTEATQEQKAAFQSVMNNPDLTS